MRNHVAAGSVEGAGDPVRDGKMSNVNVAAS